MTDPDKSITGPLSGYTSPDIKLRRREWVLARRKEGWPVKRIANALGVHMSRVSVICADSAPGKRAPLTADNIRRSVGVSLGYCGKPFDAAPPEVREALAMAAARQRKTVAEVLVESYAATLTK